nr:oxidoreductase [Nocardia yunnanensis]
MGIKTEPWTAADIPDLNGRTAIVTGANTGLGLETARQLAAHGARVVLACRDTGKGEAAALDIRRGAPGAEVSVLELDLLSLDSVRKAAAQVHDEFERIDLLVNNAGALNRKRTLTAGVETTLAANHLGPFAFTGLLLDLLRAAPDGRVVTVSNGTIMQKAETLALDDLNFERRRYKGFAAYKQSKMANALFAFELQRRLNGTDTALMSVLVHPGAAESDFARNLGPAVAFLARPSLRWMFRFFMQTVEMGALPSLRAATDPGVRGGEFLGPSGSFKGFPVRNEAGRQANDPEVAAALWAESERLSGVTYQF